MSLKNGWLRRLEYGLRLHDFTVVCDSESAELLPGNRQCQRTRRSAETERVIRMPASAVECRRRESAWNGGYATGGPREHDRHEWFSRVQSCAV